VIYNLCQLIINLTLVNVDWKEVLYNAVKCNWTITYFTSVLPLKIRSIDDWFSLKTSDLDFVKM
jgi:hypothetical protein